ncbi:hypothetical protein DL93DRAFT_2030715, partial [Clavulina sp. PMI_390]
TQEIACQLNMPRRVVQRVIKTHKDTGFVCSPNGHSGRYRAMTGPQAEYVIELLASSPDLYLDEIQACVADVFQVQVPLSTIHQTLKWLGFSSKRLSKRAAERNERKRAQFMLRIGQYQPRQLVFVDESALNIKTTYRLNGWS